MIDRVNRIGKQRLVIAGLWTSVCIVGPTLSAIEQGGPALWTGGAFGPEAGLLGVFAMTLGAVLVIVREKMRSGRVALCEEMVRPPVAVVPAPPTPAPAVVASSA